ncbi:DNA-processing protein DprA [Candidatus Saccharibacteria bacterium]|nr:DNA-processing protein DprA [Candidatus Saccharibacteria bacterium]
MDIKDIIPAESEYLKRLTYLQDPPEKLYYYGEIPSCNRGTEPNPRFPLEKPGRPKTVAIVGSRKMTAYGETWAFKLAKELAELGVIVVSGLAIGIDAAAHRGALAGGGQTIAFLGTSISKVYPAANRDLFQEIIKQHGCVLSENAPGVEIGPKLRTSSFLKRNRLISGLSDAVIIIEADLRSGSLNTASHALSQGVPVFALPGDVTRQMSRGCNGLFNKGAAAVTSVEDVLSSLFSGSIKHQKRQKIELFGSTPDETAVLKAMSRGSDTGEEIILEVRKKTPDFDVSRFNVAITTLEIRGIVKREYGNRWILS